MMNGKKYEGAGLENLCATTKEKVEVISRRIYVGRMDEGIPDAGIC